MSEDIKVSDSQLPANLRDLPPEIRQAVAPLGGNQDRIYMMKFALVDGDHIMGLVAHPSVVVDHVNVLIQTHNQQFPDNPMTGWGGEGLPELKLSSQKEIKAETAKLQSRDERIGAENQFVVPNQILHVGRDAHLERLGKSVPGGKPIDAPQEPTFGG
jgi:hypothetical protein